MVAKNTKVEEDTFPNGFNWCFAIINGSLAELYFDPKTRELWGHFYTKESSYKTKKEKEYIREDTKNVRFSYRNKTYKPIQKKA